MGYNKNDFEGSASFLTGAELLFHNKSEASHPHILELIAKLAIAEEGAELKKNKNVPGGYAGLDGDGRVLRNILPEITGSLIGKGVITEEKLSEEVLKRLSGLVEKEGEKVLSDNNFSNENLEAVLKIGSLEKSIAQMIASYVGKNTFNEHVQNANIHVSVAEIDSAIKTVQKYASTVAEGRQIVEKTAKQAEKSLEEIEKHANACADNAEEAKSAASQAEKAYEDAVECAGICINTSETAEDAAERAKQAAETTKEKMVSASQDYSNAVKHTMVGDVVAVNNASFVEHEIKARLLSKNLIPFPYFDVENTSLYGVSIKADDYGAVALSGTATNDIYWGFYDAGSYENPEENVPLGIEPLRNYTLSFDMFGSVSGGELSVQAIVGDAPEGSISLRQRKWLMTTGEAVTGQMYSGLLTFSLILYIPSGTTVNCEIRPRLRLADDTHEPYEWNDMSYVNPTQAKLIQYGENLLDIGRAENIYGATALEGITGKKYLRANILDAKYCEIELSYLARILEQLAGHTITFSAAISNRNVGQPAIIITYIDGSTVMAEGAGDKVTLKLPKPVYPVESIKIRPLSSSDTFTDTSTLIYDLSLKIDDDSWGYKDFIMNEFAPNEKGEISGMKSLSQTMTFETYDGVVVDLEYNADTEKAIDALAEQTKEEIQAEADKIYATKNVVSNALQRSVSSTNIRLDDVSPIEHSVGARIRSVNHFNISAIRPTNTSAIYAYISEIGADYIKIVTPTEHTGVGYANSTKTLRELCPQLEIGKTYTLYLNPSVSTVGQKAIHLAGEVSTMWYLGSTLTITEAMLKSQVAFYGHAATEEAKTVTISDIMIIEGTADDVPNVYIPYVDPSTVSLARYGKNLFCCSNFNISRYGITATAVLGESVFHITGTSTEAHQIAEIGLFDLPPGTFTASIFGANKISVFFDRIYLRNMDMNEVIINDITVDNPKTFTLTEAARISVNFVLDKESTYKDSEICIQIEPDDRATDYEPYIEPATYTPNVDGKVEGITSLAPTMTFFTDKEGAVIDLEYNKDINKAFAELQQAIISLGGNV